MNKNSGAQKSQSVQRLATEWTAEGVGVRVAVRASFTSFIPPFKSVSGVHPISCPVDTGDCFFRKRKVREADQSLSSTIKVRNAWVCTSTSQYIVVSPGLRIWLARSGERIPREAVREFDY
jgi:hypothetical protein